MDPLQTSSSTVYDAIGMVLANSSSERTHGVVLLSGQPWKY